MMRSGVRRTLAATIGALSVVAIAASTGAAATPSTATVVSSTTNPKLGPILVADRTVYTLKPSKTACSTACLKAWPAVLLPHGVKTPTAGAGVDASKLGTAKAAKGNRQITYAGKRLYWYVKDKAPGQVHGNVTDKWGKWATVTVAVSTGADTSTTAPTGGSTTAPPTDAPVTAPPANAAPGNTAPANAAPQTAPPATEPPATAPPATQPTSPPRTDPPATTSPGNGGVGF